MRNRTYRYYEGTPLYPFGYGLTYGNAAVLSVAADKQEAHVVVRNDGPATEDVLQLYIKDNASPDAPTNPILCGFQRIHLNQGEEKEVVIPIHPNGFTVVGEDGIRVPGSGSWTLYAGFGQPDSRTRELTGKECAFCRI